MNGSIISWLLLAISTISILSDVATASTSAPAPCLGIEQRSLLLKLRNNLVFNPSASSKLVQWDRSADSWSGVMCEDGLVVGLDLSEEWISGGIGRSSSLFRLEFLRSLNLAFNNFDSLAIPSSLANLSRLVHLNLSNAGFDGQIPAELSRLTKLRTLDLSMMFLEMPSLRSLIGDLGELRELYLDWVNVSTEESEWCDALSSSVPKLEVLSMSSCSLSGPIKASLMSLANLSVIQLVGNNLNTTVPSFLANFSNLKTLSLSYCGLQGEFPPEIFQVQTLQTLDVSFNELLRCSLPIFPENSSLQTLVLSFTNISGRLPDSIGNLRNLSIIELVNCSFDGNIPSSLTNLPRLSYLDLSLNNLTGSTPSLSKAKNLILIILSGNSLTGPIDSTQWESLLSLLILDLRFNLLEGSIPSSLFTHPSIQQLLLTNNRFSGQLKGFFNAPSHVLTTVDLSRNNIGGELPMSVWELQGLNYLSLSSNNFSDSFHLNLVQQLRNLSHLDLSHNHFSIYATNTTSQASSFPYLNYLNLASCQLMTLPQFLANQSTLLFLDLSHNYIKGYIPRWIWTLENLWHLNLSSNFFDHLETPLGNLTSAMVVVDLHSNMLRGNMPPLTLNAHYLDFSSNNINSVITDDINLLNSMFFFSLSKNNLHGSIPKSICKADSLAVLDLSHNHLNGTIPDCLIMATLEVLNLRNNQLSGHIPQNIQATCSLSRLDLSENLLTGQIPLSLANCTMLEIMNIGDNQIEGTFPCHFKAMSSLRVLILRSNQLRGEIRCPHSPSTWKILQIIDLSSNDFSGTLPASLLTSWDAMKANVDFDHLHLSYFTESDELYYEDTIRVTFKGLQLELVKILTIFTSIDFSSNRLEGPILNTLGDLKALYFLNLSHNAIFGSIPSVLGSLDQLESLDLSWNYLNGTIPAELANLNFLSFLNLSNNQLVGSIPTRGQFLTFPKSSFEGNLGLCGLSMNKSCSTTTNGTEEAGSVPTQSDIDDDNNDDSKKWFYMGIPLGFAVGFWVFCGPIVFIRSWRFAYYRFWDKVMLKQSRP